MNKIVSFFASAAFMVVSHVHARHLGDGLLFAAKLEGAQQVPAITNNAIGVASVFVNSSRDSAFVNITASKLSGVIMGIHIHEGRAGSNGPVLVSLEDFVSGNRIVGKLGKDVVTPSFLRKLLKDSLYVNVHTALNPSGEIRGQLLLESDIAYTAWLQGSQEVPAVSTPAYGLGTFLLSKDLSALKINVVVQGLSGPITGAHLHKGAQGTNGGVVVDLLSAVNDSVISTTIDPTAILADLALGNIYINVHTSTYAGGEIRGQLKLHRSLTFDAWLDGQQQTPAVATDAKGVASVSLSPSLDTLWYKVVATGLSGAITGAHFHRAAVDSSGPVVLDIADSIQGNMVVGSVTGEDLNPALINDFLKGRLYINLHTAAHPAGEIRGQVYKVAREGYTLSLQGTQEVPATTSSASGSGIVSVNRDQTNAFYLIVVNELSGAITSAHFHLAPKGENGNVEHDITSKFSRTGPADAAWGYWTSTNGFDAAIAKSLSYDSVYVNLHTAANPTGETRGQVVRGAEDSEIVTSVVDNYINDHSYILAPNPSQGMVQLNFEGLTNAKAKVSINDIYGKEVLVKEMNISTGTNSLLLNLESLSNGIYQVTIHSDRGLVSQKLVKN